MSDALAPPADSAAAPASNAIASAARSFGAEIRCNASVAHVIVKNGRAIGVALDNGARIAACIDAVVPDNLHLLPCPAEVEAAVSAHPNVRSCIVVGVPDPNSGDLGQVPYALVHAADGSALDADGVKDFLRERISSYKVPPTPDFIEFVSTPLRDDAGKARRSAVRAEVMARLRPPQRL